MSVLEKLKEKIQIANIEWQFLEEQMNRHCFSKPLIGYQACIKSAYSRLCVNHAINASKLIGEGFLTSGNALIRPCLDAYGRQLLITYKFDEDGCRALWEKMDEISRASKSGDFKKVSKIDDLKEVLPYGRGLVNALKETKLPPKIPFFSDFKTAFDTLNSATHGGISTVMLLLTNNGLVSEPEVSFDHFNKQTLLIKLRAMSLIALLFSEDMDSEAALIKAEYQRIVSGVSTLLDGVKI